MLRNLSHIRPKERGILSKLLNDNLPPNNKLRAILEKKRKFEETKPEGAMLDGTASEAQHRQHFVMTACAETLHQLYWPKIRAGELINFLHALKSEKSRFGPTHPMSTQKI